MVLDMSGKQLLPAWADVDLVPPTQDEVDAVLRLIGGREDADFLARMLGLVDVPVVRVPVKAPVCVKHNRVKRARGRGNGWQCQSCHYDAAKARRERMGK